MKIKKVYVDVLTALAKGTDAGIYRLNPKRVEIVSREQDVKRVLAECEKTGKSVTFKAGGDRKSTRLNSSHRSLSRMPSSA